jgi:hypothetical protein
VDEHAPDGVVGQVVRHEAHPQRPPRPPPYRPPQVAMRRHVPEARGVVPQQRPQRLLQVN